MFWGPPDRSSAPEGYQNSTPSDKRHFKICTKLPTPEGSLIDDQNGQLGTCALPTVELDSGASQSNLGQERADSVEVAHDVPVIRSESVPET
mmetsp:Transcript_43280/g.90637  ORF Transcript_43280/g.90637 Transcript_43280/m.90637 type:complete len:92 (+) Transcript_43280:2990-3265(+)